MEAREGKETEMEIKNGVGVGSSCHHFCNTLTQSCKI